MNKKISNYDFINVSIVSLTVLIYKTSIFVNSRAGYSGSVYAGQPRFSPKYCQNLQRKKDSSSFHCHSLLKKGLIPTVFKQFYLNLPSCRDTTQAHTVTV